MSKLNWESYDSKGFYITVAGQDFDLSYSWNSGWRLAIDSLRCLTCETDSYTSEQAKIWAEKEILTHFNQKIADLLSVVALLGES